MRLIIADTSCFILFSKIDELDVLKNTFSKIVVTDKVVEEYGEMPGWVQIRSDYNKEVYRKLNLNFGPGESSSIALAQEEKNPILLIDDRRAKRIAEDIGIECIGSLGVLLIAKKTGKINTISEIIEKIRETNFYVSERIVKKVLKLANE